MICRPIKCTVPTLKVSERMPFELSLTDKTPELYDEQLNRLPSWKRKIAKIFPIFRPEVNATFMQDKDWIYISKSKGAFLVPAGFVSDYASIPQAVQNLIPKMGPWNYAAWLHDWLYKTAFFGKDGRKDADLMIKEVMEYNNVDDITVSLIYDGVRIGGGSSYGENKDLAVEYRSKFFNLAEKYAEYKLATPVSYPELAI